MVKKNFCCISHGYAINIRSLYGHTHNPFQTNPLFILPAVAAIAPRARDGQNAQLPPPPPPSSSSVSVKAGGEGDRGHIVPPSHPLSHQQQQQPPPKEKPPGKQ